MFGLSPGAFRNPSETAKANSGKTRRWASTPAHHWLLVVHKPCAHFVTTFVLFFVLPLFRFLLHAHLRSTKCMQVARRVCNARRPTYTSKRHRCGHVTHSTLDTFAFGTGRDPKVDRRDRFFQRNRTRIDRAFDTGGPRKTVSRARFDPSKVKWIWSRGSEGNLRGEEKLRERRTEVQEKHQHSPTRHLTVATAPKQSTWVDEHVVELLEMLDCEGKEMREGKFEGEMSGTWTSEKARSGTKLIHNPPRQRWRGRWNHCKCRTGI